MKQPLAQSDIDVLRQMKQDVEDLKTWKQGIRVDGAAFFANRPTGMQIAIPGPPKSIPEANRYDTVTVKVIGTLAGGGCYTGSLYAGGLTVSGSSNLSMPENMTAQRGVLVLNQAETGTPTHQLAIDDFATGKLIGANSSGLIVAIDDGVCRTASPVTLLTSTDDTPDENSWQRDRVTSGAQKGDCPVSETYLSRAFDSEPDGDGIVTRTWFQRTRIIDAGGREYSISDETIAFTDTFKDCPPAE